jgi:hypothetical protein
MEVEEQEEEKQKEQEEEKKEEKEEEVNLTPGTMHNPIKYALFLLRCSWPKDHKHSYRIIKTGRKKGHFQQ